MTNQQLQWLLSLSSISLVGPGYDLDILEAKGFYKKGPKEEMYFDRYIDSDRKCFDAYKEHFESFLNDLYVEDRRSYLKKVNELCNGSEFSSNLTKLVNIGRTLSLEDRLKEQPYIINGRLYFYDMFELVMTYEYNWPDVGLEAYDIANAIMLLRMGRYLDYLDDDEQMFKLEELYIKASKYDYKTFGQAANIGREIHIRMLDEVLHTSTIYESSLALAACHYGIWDHMEN